MSASDAPSLRFPEPFPAQANVTHEAAINMLSRAAQLALQQPFVWCWIDKPSDGAVFLLFVQGRFPNDGIRFLEPEQHYRRMIGAHGELEVYETKYGFIPGSGETSASRVRRRYRLSKGGNQNLVLVHYSRGQGLQVPPLIANQPIRQYPLRPLNEPAMFVAGDKVGQKIPLAGGGGGIPVGGGFPGRGDPHAMLAQQNREMEALDRRAQRDRSASMNQRMPPQQQRPVDDEDSSDELEQISTRTLALSRYKRNHELMNEVFMHAAFGDKTIPKTPPAYSIFSKDDLEAKLSKLTSEIQDLRAKSAAREALPTSSLDNLEQSDVSMSMVQSPSAPMVGVEGGEA